MKRCTVSILSVALALMLVFSMAPAHTVAEELPVLRVAVMPFYVSAAAYYISATGLDVENGFKMDLQPYPMGAPQIEAMAANEWDVGMMGSAAVFGVANNGMMPICEMIMSSGGTGAFIRPDHPAAKVKGEFPGYPEVYGNKETLKGAQVLVPIGSLNHLNVVKWFDVVGLTQEEYSIVHMDNAASFQAFKAGQGDVTAFSPPLSYQAEEQEGWVNGASLTGLNFNVYDNIYANPLTYKEMYPLLVKFIKVHIQVQDLFTQNPELAAEWGFKWLHDENGLAYTLDMMRQEVPARPFRTSAELREITDFASLRELAKFYISVGNLEPEAMENFDNPEVINLNVLKDALALLDAEKAK